MSYTSHVDTFTRDNLPPRELWPEFIFELPECTEIEATAVIPEPR